MVEEHYSETGVPEERVAVVFDKVTAAIEKAEGHCA
jgi:hypothetical protein